MKCTDVPMLRVVSSSMNWSRSMRSASGLRRSTYRCHACSTCGRLAGGCNASSLPNAAVYASAISTRRRRGDSGFLSGGRPLGRRLHRLPAPDRGGVRLANLAGAAVDRLGLLDLPDPDGGAEIAEAY